MTSTEAPAATPRVRIWDLPVRLTHWAIAALFAFQWWSGKTGRLDWHFLAGYTVIGLLVFRLLWGVMGSSTARFAGFVRGPVAVARYVRKLFMRGDGRFHVGHNPLGGWSVVLMLALLLVQTGLGLFAIDVDGDEGGPLSARVSFDARARHGPPARLRVQHPACCSRAARACGAGLSRHPPRQPDRPDADRIAPGRDRRRADDARGSGAVRGLRGARPERRGLGVQGLRAMTRRVVVTGGDAGYFSSDRRALRLAARLPRRRRARGLW